MAEQTGPGKNLPGQTKKVMCVNLRKIAIFDRRRRSADNGRDMSGRTEDVGLRMARKIGACCV
jgi:hypothetical protein